MVWNHDHWLIGEAHASGEWGVITSNQVGSLVDLEPNAMACAMRKAGKLIVRTQSMGLKYRSCRRIDLAAGSTNLCCVKGRSLRLFLQLPERFYVCLLYTSDAADE